MSSSPFPAIGRVPRAVREPQMLDAAVRVFAAHGYRGASMDEIARETGVTKPMVYAYFGSKEALYVACIAHGGARLSDAIAAAGAGETASERQTWSRLLAFFSWVAEHRDEWRLLHREHDAPFAEQVGRARAGVVALVEGQLEEAARVRGADPVLAEELEPLAQALVGAGESLATWWLDHPERPAEAMARALMNLVWLGFGDLVEGRRWAPPGPADPPSRPAP
jgi:AcrR family transcriptional regulator